MTQGELSPFGRMQAEAARENIALNEPSRALTSSRSVMEFQNTGLRRFSFSLLPFISRNSENLLADRNHVPLRDRTSIFSLRANCIF